MGGGWYIAQFPDGKPTYEQDAYFVQALEIICATYNRMMIEESGKK